MLPKGNKIHEDLSSEFVRIDQLLGELREKNFRGYLEFEENGKKGYTLFENGSPTKTKLMKNGDEEIAEGVSGLTETLEKGSFMMNVVECDEAACEIVKIKIENEKMQEDLSPEDVDLRNFLTNNVTEQELDCHILVVSEDSTGVITMTNGIPSEAKFNTNRESLVGNEALSKILDYVENNNVSLDIHRVREEEEREKEEEIKGVEEEFDKEEIEAEVEEEVSELGKRMEDDLTSMTEGFADKADDLLDDMGLGDITEEEET